MRDLPIADHAKEMSSICSSEPVEGLDFNLLYRFIEHSDADSAANCCHICAANQVSVGILESRYISNWNGL